MDTPNTSILTSLGNAVTPPAGSVATSPGGQIAALEARLKVLLKSAKNVGLDTNMSAQAKKTMLQALQMEIQMLMQRIAEMESDNKKGATPMQAVLESANDDSNDKANAVIAKEDNKDTQYLFPANRIDISV